MKLTKDQEEALMDRCPAHNHKISIYGFRKKECLRCELLDVIVELNEKYRTLEELRATND